jgi:hypothetical protein
LAESRRKRQPLAAPVTAVAMLINQSLLRELAGAQNREKHKLSALADSWEGRPIRNEAEDAGEKSLLTMTPSQAITNLDNLAVRMVMGLRPL